MFHLSARSRARHPALPYFCHCCLPVPPRCPLGGWTGQWTCAPLALASITLFAAFTHLLAQCKLGRHPLLHELLFWPAHSGCRCLLSVIGDDLYLLPWGGKGILTCSAKQKPP